MEEEGVEGAGKRVLRVARVEALLLAAAAFEAIAGLGWGRMALCWSAALLAAWALRAALPNSDIQIGCRYRQFVLFRFQQKVVQDPDWGS